MRRVLIGPSQDNPYDSSGPKDEVLFLLGQTLGQHQLVEFPVVSISCSPYFFNPLKLIYKLHDKSTFVHLKMLQTIFVGASFLIVLHT